VTIHTSFIADEANTARVGVRPPLGEKRVSLRTAQDHDQSTDYADDTDFY
jgi:hypothetical protein